jgi:hypothetical protein
MEATGLVVAVGRVVVVLVLVVVEVEVDVEVEVEVGFVVVEVEVVDVEVVFVVVEVDVVDVLVVVAGEVVVRVVVTADVIKEGLAVVVKLVVEERLDFWLLMGSKVVLDISADKDTPFLKKEHFCKNEFLKNLS